MMKVLVIGSNGFIGQHVSKGLEQFGRHVYRADISNVEGSQCIIVDQLKPNFIDVFKHQNYDVCINCSGAASVPESISNPFHDFTLNTVRIAEMLEALRQASPATKFINLSSAAVYGNPSKIPILETAPLRPVSPYGWHKLQAEEICREYSELYGIGTLSLRIFSAYGPGLRKQLFWDVYQKALKADTIELFGTGEETRDFIFVEDLVSVINLLIQKAEFDGKAINVANGKAVSVKDAVTAFINSLGLQKDIHFTGEGREGDPQCWQADILHLTNLGFSPEFSMEAGLYATAKWILMS